MGELYLIDWGDLAEDLGPGAPASASNELLRNMWQDLGGRGDEEIIPMLMAADVALPDPTVLKNSAQACEEAPDLLKTYRSRPLPKPSKQARQFLCNNQCPKQCCTLHCPWNSMACDLFLSPEATVDIFGRPCLCNSWTCRKCVQERLLQRYADPHPVSLVSAPRMTLECRVSNQGV